MTEHEPAAQASLSNDGKVITDEHKPATAIDREQPLRTKVIGPVNATNSTVKVRSETGSPVQLSDFRPVACASLARVGNENDGGYVVPLDAIAASRALLSFGLSHNWTFERDFKKLNADAIIHCYDHTVTLGTALQYSIGQLLRFFLLFRAGAFRRAFTWIDYLLFFRADKIHVRQRLWRDRENDSATIDDAFDRLPAKCQVFVKMDIEGSEYHVLEDLLAHAQDIVALAIEFHDVDIVPDQFNTVVEKIKRDFYIVHIHGNNMGGMTPFHFPTAPEITFLNKRFFSSVPAPSRLNYPVPGLDRPNNAKLPDFTFEF